MDRAQLRELNRQLAEAAMSDPNPVYGQKIVWHEFPNCRLMVHVSGTNMDHVRAEAIRAAKKMGWTPPKWWQFWRWSDTRIEA